MGATVFFNDTVGGKIGTEGFQLDPILDPFPAAFNEAPKLRDFDQNMTLSSVHSYAPCLVVKQDEPLPMTITGWAPKIAPGG